MFRASCNKHTKWSWARLTPLPATPEDAPATEVTESVELPLPWPSPVPEVVISSESEEQLQPHKWGRPQAPAVEPSSSRRSPSPSSATPSGVEPSQIHTERLPSPPPELNTNFSSIPRITSGHSLPHRQRSPPPNSTLMKIMAIEEAELKDKSLAGLCDLMNATNIKVPKWFFP